MQLSVAIASQAAPACVYVQTAASATTVVFVPGPQVVITGSSTSVTVTICEQVLVFPWLSVTDQVIVVAPGWKTTPSTEAPPVPDVAPVNAYVTIVGQLSDTTASQSVPLFV